MLINRQVSYRIAFAFEFLRGMQDGMVFDHCRDEMRLIWRKQMQGPEQSEVVGFGSSTSKDNLIG